MQKNIIKTSTAPEAIGPYSQGILAGNLLFVSGQIPINPDSGGLINGSIEEETKQVMDNIRAIITAAGLEMADIVKTTIYLTDMSDFAKVNEVYGSYFTSEPPARVTVQVAGLPKGVRIEIDAIAMHNE